MSKVPLAKIAGTLAMLAFLFSLQRIRRPLPREILLLALLIGQLLLASALSPVWRGGAFQVTLDFAKVIAVIIAITAVVNTPLRLRLLIFTQAASVASIAAVTLWKGHLLSGRLNGLLGGPYSDPNDLALALVVSLPQCLALLLLRKGWIWKAGWTAAIVVMIFAILLTGSRGGFLSIIVTSAVCLWSFAIRGRRSYLLGLAALLAIIVSLSSGAMIIGRLRGTFSLKEDTVANGSAQARRELFWRSIEVTKEHPLFGVGPGNFVQLSGNWHVAHNSFTQMSSEGGIPALILYILILWRGFKNIRAARRFANKQRGTILFGKALHASLVGFVVGSCFLSMNFAFSPYVLVAYTTALFVISKKFSVRPVGGKSECDRVALRAGPSQDWNIVGHSR
jgi:putative inorganic carbon (HCO3(-)) transporter